MSDEPVSEQESDPADAPRAKAGLKGLLLGAFSTLLLAGVAGGVVYVAPFGDEKCNGSLPSGAAGSALTKDYENIEFVNLDPLIITLGPGANAEFLKISISIETTKDNLKAAEHLRPRFRDVLNIYLRAVEEKDLVEPSAMTRIRAQMLRRLQVTASPEIVTDLLITDFVLN